MTDEGSASTRKRAQVVAVAKIVLLCIVAFALAQVASLNGDTITWIGVGIAALLVLHNVWLLYKLRREH